MIAGIEVESKLCKLHLLRGLVIYFFLLNSIVSFFYKRIRSCDGKWRNKYLLNWKFDVSLLIKKKLMYAYVSYAVERMCNKYHFKTRCRHRKIGFVSAPKVSQGPLNGIFTTTRIRLLPWEMCSAEGKDVGMWRGGEEGEGEVVALSSRF